MLVASAPLRPRESKDNGSSAKPLRPRPSPSRPSRTGSLLEQHSRDIH